MLIYCVLFAIVPVVAWLSARRVSTFERRLVAAVMVIVPTGLIVFVMVMTRHGSGAPASLSAADGPNAATASWSLGPLLQFDTAPATVAPTIDASVEPPPPNTVGLHALALGGRPDAKSEKQPGSTKALTPGLTPTTPTVPVGTILPAATFPPTTEPTTDPTPPRPSPPGQPTTSPPTIVPTTPATTPPGTTPPPTTPPRTTTEPLPPTSDAPAPTTKLPVVEPTSAEPTTPSEPVTTEVSDSTSTSALLSAVASLPV
ncbi:hypothetical protein [Pseudofrankia sp. DC12]|uniref:hypothetical protein n=1 Tax=Pseudofrankia sp. DC12 TaxID=683315 RepID=UPI0012FC5B38|nr:hypothetical protein [Pseudofrankia sp. DC12]